jgi:hypothetical protein
LSCDKRSILRGKGSLDAAAKTTAMNRVALKDVAKR